MDGSLLTYIERLEYLAFFAGYPLLYSIVHFLAGNRHAQPGGFPQNIIRLLPIAYAFTGTLFLGLVLKDFTASGENIQKAAFFPYLKIWGIGAALFWIPALGRKPSYSLAHSLVFFSLILKDILVGMNSVSGRDLVKNDMKIYAVSFLLNAISLVIIIISRYFLSRFSQSKRNVTRS